MIRSAEPSSLTPPALATADEVLKADLAEMEQAWLELANNFKALKSFEDFLLDSVQQRGISLSD